MHDQRKWRLAVVEFNAIRMNIPRLVSEAFVRDYHVVLGKMAAASSEDLDTFRISIESLKPRVVSFQMHTGRKQYSRDNYCDSNVFQRKIDALTAYLPTIEEIVNKPQMPEHPKDYWSMSTAQLEQLAHSFNIGGYGDQHGHPDRDIIIDALLRRDKALEPDKPAGSHFVNHGTILGSAIQQDSPGSSATVSHSVQEQSNLIKAIREAIPHLSLAGEEIQNLETDLATVDLQLRSSRPKRTIVDECWSSARGILEKAAGSIVAAPLLHELAKFLH
jgi:hypothetical protein